MYECVWCGVVISMCVCCVCCVWVWLCVFVSLFTACLFCVCCLWCKCQKKRATACAGKGRRAGRTPYKSTSMPPRGGLGKCPLYSHSWAEQELKTTKIHAAAAAAVRLSKKAKCQHNNLITWSAERRWRSWRRGRHTHTHTNTVRAHSLRQSQSQSEANPNINSNNVALTATQMGDSVGHEGGRGEM